jgi:signal transduction histidine kinase
VQVDCQCDVVPTTLRRETSVCLFRVLQEALQNAKKHSGSRHFQVFLRYSQEEINLCVSDFGLGFDSMDIVKGPGIGIISMRERLKLVNGELSIESKSQRGTTICASVRHGLQRKAVGASA